MSTKKRIVALVLVVIMLGASLLGFLAMIVGAAPTVNSDIKLKQVTYTFYEHLGSAQHTAINLAGNAVPQVQFNGYLTDADGYLLKSPYASYAFFRETSAGPPAFSYDNFDATLQLEDTSIKYSDFDASKFGGVKNASKLLKGDFLSAKEEPTSITFSASAKDTLLINVTYEGLTYSDSSDSAQIIFNLKYKYEATGGGAEETKQYSSLTFKLPGAQKPKDSNTVPGGDDDDDGNTGVKIKSSTPYIIISDYDIGTDSVVAGDTFTLSMVLRNTHRRINIENIIMTVTTSDGLQLTSSSNTFYIDRLKTDVPISKEFQISALANAAVKSHTINVEFSYEYIADDARANGQTKETITVPVVQKDRFGADLTEISPEIYPGDEGIATVAYVNKGRTEIFNLSAELLGGSISNPGQKQNLGNIAAGAGGTVDFYLKPNVEGDFTGEILFTYEDAVTNMKEYRITYSTTAIADQGGKDMNVPNPGDFEDVMGEPEELPKEGIPSWAWYTGGGVAVVVIAVIAKVVRSKKKAAEFEDDDETI